MDRLETAGIEIAINKNNMGNKYLSFILGSRDYALETSTIREIVRVVDIQSIPDMPSFIKGMITLQGKIIPIIDLRLKFAIPPKEQCKNNCVIVVNIQERLIGITVDAVSEILDIKESDIEDPLSFGKSDDSKCILGSSKVNNRIKIIIDINKVLASYEIEEILTMLKEAER